MMSRLPAPSGGRIVLERTLRALALIALAWAIWDFVVPVDHSLAVVSDAQLDAVLPAWTVGAAPARIDLALTGVPDPASRDWLTALARTGAIVTWRSEQGVGLSGTAIEVAAVADPAGRARELVAAPTGGRVTVEDDLGELAAASASSGGVTLEGPLPSGIASARVGHSEAGAALGDSLVLRPVLVMGRIGWESKFLIDALQGDGWTVATRLALTPRSRVIRGSGVALDTGRVAAVIVVGEPIGTDRAMLTDYVRSGGGLLLVDGADRALATLAVADTAHTIGASDTLELAAAGPPASVRVVPLVRLRPGAVVEERHGSVVAVATRTLGAGLVEQIGYRDLWRWQFNASDSTITAYRRWWGAQVAAVAYAPAFTRAQPANADPAPLAGWVDRFGPASSGRQPHGPLPVPSPAMLFAIAVTALLAEWASRRLAMRT